ncbi:hypothetical protein SBRY_90158 [Actinacidiphila bryophytorum]|uniref:Uncharacterized protein n=1 Tax=Actinacidiphila bryophytorum TaxID=1436133 RepID=A0A9W4H8H9_9ACTN|nr:hypothetical protein SBRY_90158 [Actinacidiphila bryophytorum]
MARLYRRPRATAGPAAIGRPDVPAERGRSERRPSKASSNQVICQEYTVSWQPWGPVVFETSDERFDAVLWRGPARGDTATA